MSTELAIIENLELVPFFTKGESVDDILSKIKDEAMAHVPDVSTAKGRKAITANITKVTNSKTYLEDNGKNLSAEHKLIPGVIDANRKKVKDFLNTLQADLRKPLTDWEDEQQQIKDKALKIEKWISQAWEFIADEEIATLMDIKFDLELAQAETERKAELERVAITAAAEAKGKAEQAAADKVAKAEREKQEAIDREAKAKQDAIDAQARADQADRDRIAAEKAHKENVRVDYHKRIIQHIVDCGNGFIGGSPQSFGILFRELESKIVIDESFEEFRQEAETARNEAIQKLNDCQERQVKDREKAEQQAKRDTETAAESARQVELKRQQDETDRLQCERAEREANKRHCGNVNRTAMQALITHAGLNQEQAKLAVIAIAKKLIPDVKISY